eukprot:scaffold14476_cov120-Isochrysis_galbana.AAC.4
MVGNLCSRACRRGLARRGGKGGCDCRRRAAKATGEARRALRRGAVEPPAQTQRPRSRSAAAGRGAACGGFPRRSFSLTRAPSTPALSAMFMMGAPIASTRTLTAAASSSLSINWRHSSAYRVI